MYRAPCIILYFDQRMQNYFTNYHTPTYFDNIGSSSGSWYVPGKHDSSNNIQIVYTATTQADFMRIATMY